MLKDIVGNNITKARKELKIHQKDLAKKVGITTTTLSKIENGDGGARLDVLEKIAKELQLELVDLMYEDKVFVLSKQLLKKIEESN